MSNNPNSNTTKPTKPSFVSFVSELSSDIHKNEKPSYLDYLDRLDGLSEAEPLKESVESFNSWFDSSLNKANTPNANTPKPAKPSFVSFVSKPLGDIAKNEAYLIRFDNPYKVHHYNQEQGYAEKIPYTETNHFDYEIARARVFLKNLYVRGVDIEVTAGNDLLFVPLPNKPTQDEIDAAAQLQHGIRYQINNPIDLYEQPSTTFLDDRNTCISCKHLTANKSCRKDGKGHVTWIDRQWLDKKINCTDWTAK